MGLYLYYLLLFTWVFGHAKVPLYLKELNLGGYKTLWKPDPKKSTGIEFGEISRGSLLKLMAEFAENAQERLRPCNQRTQFTAEFANNQYTRPFIYPRFFNNQQTLRTLIDANANMNQQEPGIWTETGIRQMKYSLCAVSVEISIGMAYGAGAVMQPQIVASGWETSISQGAWLVSVVYLLLPVGNLLNGFIMDSWGRSKAITLGTVPLFAGWIYTGFAKNVQNIIIGRLITGFGCGMATGPPRIYIAEIALPNVRGVLASFAPLSTSLGITIQSCLGTVMAWQHTCFLCAGYTACLFFLTMCLPETPHFLMKKNQPIEVIERSMKKFRGKSYDLELELEALEHFRSAHAIERISVFHEFKELFTRSVCQPLAIILIFILIVQMSGIAILVQWTVTILNESKLTIDSNVCNIAMSTTRFFTLMLVSVLMYHLRRKVMALSSSVGVGCCCLAIFLNLKYSTEPHWYPMIMFICYTFFSTFGFYGLPFIIMTEIYPLKVRGVLGGLTLAITNIESFLFTKLYPNVHIAIGLTNVFLIFTISCFVGTVFLYFFLPETKGLSLCEIEDLFKRRQSVVETVNQLARRSRDRSASR